MNRRPLVIFGALILVVTAWLALRIHSGQSDPTATATPAANAPDARPAVPPPHPTPAKPESPPDPPQRPNRSWEPPKHKPAKEAYPVAQALPGKPGFVLSPYNNKIIDVRDLPSGTLVSDPTQPPENRAYFRVP